MHGARVAALVLNTPALKQKWEEELHQMRGRILAMRRLFVEKLAVKTSTVDFSHLAHGNGMFGFTGLGSHQVETMQREYGIYMPVDGRMNVCGLNHSNIDYVVDALIAAGQGHH
jgi:aspartate/tyrosine/aromatic aminotransferase